MEKWSCENRKVARIWSRRRLPYGSGEDEANGSAGSMLSRAERRNLQRYREFRADIEAAGFTDVLLMGMGGSSLCPEVLAMTFGKCEFPYPRFDCSGPG